MTGFIMPLQIRWSDLDPNFHVRHSVYYDWGAFCRVAVFNEKGITPALMTQLQIGPILFREECIFRREIKSDDKLKISLEVTRSRKDFSRWSIRHQLFKNDDVLCAVINVDGAWMNISERKLMTPPGKMHEGFEHMPRSADFEWQ